MFYLELVRDLVPLIDPAVANTMVVSSSNRYDDRPARIALHNITHCPLGLSAAHDRSFAVQVFGGVREADPARLLGEKTETSYGKYARCGNENVIEQLLPADYICGFEIVFTEAMIRARENIKVERTLRIGAADREKYQEVVGCRRVREIVCEFREGRLALDRRQERLKHAVFVNPYSTRQSAMDA